MKKNITSLIEAQNSPKINHISTTSNQLYGVSLNSVYEIAPQIAHVLHTFPNHQKIKGISSGLEHSLILTNNGDLYSFGCGLRGQLGHGNIKNYDSPKLIEALGGIKIIDISCGAFHSIAISSFLDVYTFGWNTNGQIGLTKSTSGSFSDIKRCQQVYTIPNLIDFDNSENVVSVASGSKHSILKTEDNQIFVAGINNYGQLGIKNETSDEDKFIKVPAFEEFNVDRETKISCGYWKSYLIN
jgi:alpha-tubulin suppressor-like RCC1 family protein